MPSSTIIRGDWKLVNYYEYGRFELFNLRADIGESRDLSAIRPEVARPLLAELNDWVRRVRAPIPDVPNEHFQSLRP